MNEKVNKIMLVPRRQGKTELMKKAVMDYLKEHPDAVIGFASHDGIRFSKPVKQVEPLLVEYDTEPKEYNPDVKP